VPDQKHPIVTVEHHPPHAERHAAGEPPVQVQQPPQRGLDTKAQPLDIHDARTSGTAISQFVPP
jgi:hypothetical protein